MLADKRRIHRHRLEQLHTVHDRHLVIHQRHQALRTPRLVCDIIEALIYLALTYFWAQRRIR